MNFGIQAIEIYIPNTYVDQKELEIRNKVSEGKYTKGLGQLQLSFAYPFEDVNSMALTVVNNLLQKHRIKPSQVGRLEVGTQTLADKSKSTKTVLMSLFQGHHDIEGATSINACYGATNALINTLNWMGSPSWDGRYGIVVASDVAVYEDGPARPTGGAGAVALLISNKPKISFSPIRATYIDHQYDFYKPIPSSEYPIVDGKLSIESYLKAVRECYLKLKEKTKQSSIFDKTDYFCFHCPYNKMVQKAFNFLAKIDNQKMSEQEIVERFKSQVQSSLYVSQRVGNIYTGSLYACLYSLLYRNPNIQNKKALLFSYGSGLCSSMLQVTIHSNPLRAQQIEQTSQFFKNRIKIDADLYSDIMLLKQQSYGKFKGKINVDETLLSDNAFYLSQIDDKWRRQYDKKACALKLTMKNISENQRILNLIDKRITAPEMSKFYKLSIEDRRKILSSAAGSPLNENLLESGGITTQCADKMIENVIGKLSIPMGVVPMILINNKKYSVPMSIEEPSVVAATSSIGKFISPYSFATSSSPSIMIGQVHLPALPPSQLHSLQKLKGQMIDQLNEICPSMTKRNGGVKEIRIRNIDNKEIGCKDYSFDILIDVKEAMGANLINTVAEKAKEIIASMGIRTGISILSNYCLERMAISSFTIPVEHMSWKGHGGLQVAQKIIQAYQFAKKDPFRAVTHNKGIMNGIDAVCLATGQDWRAIESGAHAYASKSGKYQPLTHYRIFEKDSIQYFEGRIELPVAVGTVGGAITRNPLYKSSLMMMGLPTAQQFAEILVSIGLAQNFAALRALAIEGIQKGHMMLHCRAIATTHGVPSHLIEECCKFMTQRHKYDKQTIQTFMQFTNRPLL